MNEPAKQWVKALRSGEYKQGKSVLRKGDTFCCLGVACDLYVKQFPNRMPVVEQVDKTFYDQEHQHLPLRVKEWLGLKDAWGTWDSMFTLTQENDSGSSFLKIADLIEQHEKELFV